MGVARTFQRNNLFQNLSVIENLRLALEVRLGNPLDFFTPVGRNQKLIRRAAELMAQVHLAGDGARIARSLSYGEQRQLEIGIALAGEPELLLLDEPTSGMSPAETAQMIELIGSLPRTLSILMIEHDMNVVFSVADRITVLYYGKVLASGPPAEIQANGRVREVYLGMLALMLELENVNAYYGDSHILHGVSLAVREGEVVCLLGRNGAGKTTTILTVMGYLHPRPGRIRYDGRDIGALPPYARRAAGLRIRAAGARHLSKPDRPREPDDFCPQRRQRLLDACRGFSSCSRSCMRASAISASSYPAASNRCCQSLAR